MGFEKDENGSTWLVPTKVTHSGYNENQQIMKIVLDDGRITYQTADHRWFDVIGNRYRTVKKGSMLYSAYDCYQETSAEKLWLGGFFDGEGSANKGSLTLYQNESRPEVLEELRKRLIRADFKYTEWIDDRRSVHHFRIRGGRRTMLRFAFECQPLRKKEILQKVSRYGMSKKHKIIEMEPSSIENAYYLTTGTGNYIVSSLFSANCQQLNSPSGGIDGQRPFPVVEGVRPVWISRDDFTKNVRIAYYEISVDTAETDGKRSNYSSIAVCGWSAAGRPFIVEIDHGKYLPDELIRRIVELRLKYNPRVVKIEQTAFVRGLMPALNREMHMKGFYIPIEEIKRDNQVSKIERIQLTLQPWYKSGDLRFLSDIKCKDHLVKELKEFPLSTTDDILDSIADLFQGKEWFGREIPRAVYDHSEYKAVMERSFERWVLGTDLENSPDNNYNGFFDRTGGL